MQHLCGLLINFLIQTVPTILSIRMLNCVLLMLDMDECDLDLDDCDAHAVCNNIESSFECICQDGYVMDSNEVCTSKT